MKVQNKDGKGNPWHSDKNGQFTKAGAGNAKTEQHPSSEQPFIRKDEKNTKYIAKTLDKQETSGYNSVDLKDVMSRVKSYEGKPEGTYDYHTGEKLEFDYGFMVTFHQNQPDGYGHYLSHYGRYSAEEYDKIATDFANDNQVDAVTIGVFDDEPEISFLVKTIEQAYQLMNKYNQKSVWDNVRGRPRPNRDYDKTKNPMRGD